MASRLTVDQKMALRAPDDQPFGTEVARVSSRTGLSSYGYDIRVADEFRSYEHQQQLMTEELDPKSFVDLKADTCIVPPNSFALARRLNNFRIPRNVRRSARQVPYARCGIIVNVTPFEPEWEGTATLEIRIRRHCPRRCTPTRGSPQVLFFRATRCARSYADKRGKYLKQLEVTLRDRSSGQSCPFAATDCAVHVRVAGAAFVSSSAIDQPGGSPP